MDASIVADRLSAERKYQTLLSELKLLKDEEVRAEYEQNMRLHRANRTDAAVGAGATWCSCG